MKRTVPQPKHQDEVSQRPLGVTGNFGVYDAVSRNVYSELFAKTKAGTVTQQSTFENQRQIVMRARGIVRLVSLLLLCLRCRNLFASFVHLFFLIFCHLFMSHSC